MIALITESDRGEGKHLTNGRPGHGLKVAWQEPQNKQNDTYRIEDVIAHPK
jgi:hypothetical protein